MSGITFPKDEVAALRRSIDAALALRQAGGSEALPPVDPIVLQRMARENVEAEARLRTILAPRNVAPAPSLLAPQPRGARRLLSVQDDDELPPRLTR